MTDRDKEFWMFRGLAIEEFAKLERNLCALFTCLTEMKDDTGEMVFYKIFDTQKRDQIIDELLRHKLDDKFNKYKEFWTESILKSIRTISVERNAIVHWSAIDSKTINADGTRTKNDVMLYKNSKHNKKRSGTDPITMLILKRFIHSCKETRALLECFRWYLQNPKSLSGWAGSPQAWQGIFQSKVYFPLQSTHLIYQIPTILGIQYSAYPA
jgi:hypothetical protein